MTHASIPAETRRALGLSDTLIRLSPGCESPRDLVGRRRARSAGPSDRLTVLRDDRPEEIPEPSAAPSGCPMPVMRRVWLALVVVSAGCASAPKQNAGRRSRWKARIAKVLEGCYDCLLEARDDLRAVWRPARCGRASCPGSSKSNCCSRCVRKNWPWISRRRSPAPATSLKELPPVLEGPRYLAIVEGIRSDDVGTPRAEDGAFRRAQGRSSRGSTTSSRGFVARTPSLLRPAEKCQAPRRAQAPKRAARLAGKPRPARRSPRRRRSASRSASIWCSRSTACTGRAARPRPPGTPPPPPVNRDPGPAAPPLVTYRFAICGRVQRAPIEKVRVDVPRFVEASFFQARIEVAESRQTQRRASCWQKRTSDFRRRRR